MTPGYEPRFDIQLRYGDAGQALVEKYLGLLGTSRLEVKRKTRPDAEIYIELWQDPGGTSTRWKPSGLNVTTADVWVEVFADTGIVLWLPTDLLRWAITQDKYAKEKAAVDGDNPTTGRLLNVGYLLGLGSRQWMETRETAT